MNAAITPAPRKRYLAFNVAYQIEPGTKTKDMLEEAMSFLGSATDLVNDAAMNAEAKHEQSSLYGIFHLLNLSQELVRSALDNVIRMKGAST